MIKVKDAFFCLKNKYVKWCNDVCTFDYAFFSLLSLITNEKIINLKLNKELYISHGQFENLTKYMDDIYFNEKPLQYLIGKVHLYNEEFFVNESVLIPRQDTETLIETSINIINANNLKFLLDMCTGSGAIGISVAKNSKIESIDFVDKSSGALDIVKKNIQHNNLEKQTNIICSDLFTSLYGTGYKYDIIISNPPYISFKEYEKLSSYVKKEPKDAFVAANDGLEFYIKIAREAKDFLINGGYLCFEIGYNQAEAVSNILHDNLYQEIQIIKDINNNDRVITCRFLNK